MWQNETKRFRTVRVDASIYDFQCLTAEHVENLTLHKEIERLHASLDDGRQRRQSAFTHSVQALQLFVLDPTTTPPTRPLTLQLPTHPRAPLLQFAPPPPLMPWAIRCSVQRTRPMNRHCADPQHLPTMQRGRHLRRPGAELQI